MSGTRIRAARGYVNVESVQPGDEVVVLRDGQEVCEPVKWVGHSAINLARHAHVELVAPIRIRTGAIAENAPVRDLFVSPEHCLIIDGRCVAAKLLVNGGSIVSERNHAPFGYHHIELERHGILLAEDTQAESYLDTGNRAAFNNFDGNRQLHPTFPQNPTSERWQTDACAPLANETEVAAIWTRLAERSAVIGFPIPEVITVADADIRIVADGAVIVPTSARDSRYVFMVPAGVTSVSLVSRFCIPSDKMVASQRDTRRLGVRVNWIAIRSEGCDTIFSADHPALQAGWNDVEGEGKSIWRWTDGSASIPWENVAGSAVLTVCCTQVDEYPLYDDKARLVA
jgi:hypothetical protein